MTSSKGRRMDKVKFFLWIRQESFLRNGGKNRQLLMNLTNDLGEAKRGIAGADIPGGDGEYIYEFRLVRKYRAEAKVWTEGLT